MQGKINRKDYLKRRDEHIALLRGVADYDLFGESPRVSALRQMDEQEKSLRKAAAEGRVHPLISNASWTPIGPAPIPNGQTQTVTNSVSGRVTCIAVHPTNPDIVYIGTAQGGVFRTLNGGQTWTALMNTAATLAIGIYRITSADTTPTLEGPFQTRVAGTGTAVGNGNAFLNNGITRIAVDPTDGNTIFVGTTFAFSGMNGDFTQLSTAGIYRSSNALGVAPTFSRMNVVAAGGIPVTDVVLEPGNPDNLIFAQEDLFGAATNGVYRSTNARATTPTFTRTLVTPDFENIKLAINKVSTTVTVLAAVEDGGGGSLKRSTDGGATFPTTLASANGFCGGQCFYDMAPELDPTNASIIYLGGSAEDVHSSILKKSSDGTNFAPSDTGLHADNHAVAVAPSNPNVVYTGTDGGMWRSNDKGVTWSSLNNTGLNTLQFESLAVHPTDRYFTIGGTQDNGTEFLQPSNNWKRADFGDGGFARIDQTATDTTNVVMYHTYFNATGFLIGFGRVSKTDCATEGHWALKGVGASPGFVNSCGDVEGPNGILAFDNVLFYAPLELGPPVTGSIGQTVYFGTNRLYRSINKGETMVLASQAPIVSGQKVSAIGIAPSNDNVRIVGLQNGALFFTTTGLPTLTSLDATAAGSIIPNKYISRVVFDPTNADTAYITLDGFTGAQNHVWKVTNLSTTPVKTNVSGTGATGIPDVPVNAFAIDPTATSTLYAGTDIGVYVSTNGGATWAPFGTGLPRVAVFDMAIQNPSRILRVATHGRGLWEIGLATTLTISGKVTNAGATGVQNVAVVLQGSAPAPQTVSTDALGNYTFTGLSVGGNYTVRPQHGTESPALNNYTPAYRTFVDLAASQTNVDFVGAPTGSGSSVNTSDVNISEFRLRGAGGADDEFVELYNNTNADITVQSSDGTEGWRLNDSTGAVAAVVPNGTVIPARGHFLIAGRSYTLSALATPDMFLQNAISDDAGLLLARSASTSTAADNLDAVGFTTAASAAFREGAGLTPPGAANADYSFVRKLTTGLPQDTGDNASDFALVSTTGAAIGSATAALGSPGPENSASPLQRNGKLKATLFDPTAASTSPPNRVRDSASTGVNRRAGTLTFRRKFTNNTGQTVTRLRFRVVDITTLKSPGYGLGGQANVRLLDSSDQLVTATLSASGTTTSQPPLLSLGGGLNTSAVVVLPDAGLLPGHSINVQFVLGVVQTGSFRFFVNVEALP